MTTLLKCLACGEITAMREGRNACPCGRSAAQCDDALVEIQGPGRILVPAEDVATLDGLPWMTVPEEPVIVRRATVAPLV